MKHGLSVRYLVDCRETTDQYKVARFEGQWDEWNANPPWQPWTDFKNAIQSTKSTDGSHQYLIISLERPRRLGRGGSVRDPTYEVG